MDEWVGGSVNGWMDGWACIKADDASSISVGLDSGDKEGNESLPGEDGMGTDLGDGDHGGRLEDNFSKDFCPWRCPHALSVHVLPRPCPFNIPSMPYPSMSCPHSTPAMAHPSLPSSPIQSSTCMYMLHALLS